ncbi:MAG TPA: ParA family partition ATPase [bacterium]|uniref:Chromosome-partitioning ATPase Soj n=1 Tax=candidate division TA06 bacterium ADurb.Bin417 TaxID=1852828 RepID=A0A1V5MJZ2_UNCT6|nr:MAG: Chromosome-partitioning ATPase Soj [candidate division TA06 bacterium ADurb.Bin417]HNQ36034.1 ParA family partition ATPase [bacterium]HNS48867.1 ParA family partition ATPase [bacterium]
MIITVGNEKGGVGKSTIACNLAVEAVRHRRRTLLIDADSQQSAMDFRAVRSENAGLPQFQAVGITKNTIHKDIQGFRGYDLIIIDSGGRDTQVFRSAILASDLFIIPVLTSQYDVWATQGTTRVLEEARSFKDIEARLVINQLIPNTIVAREASDLLEGLGVSLLKTRLHARVAYKQAIAEGKGVSEYEPGGKAAREIQALWREVGLK